MRYFVLILSSFSFLIAFQDSDSFYSAFKYRNIGPTRGGRVTAVEGVEKTPGIFYTGATGGGLFKTTGVNEKCSYYFTTSSYFKYYYYYLYPFVFLSNYFRCWI